MRRFSAQNLVEFTLLGLILLTASIFGVYFFSENFAPVLSENSTVAVYDEARTEKVITDADYMSDVNFTVNGESFTSPLETIMNNSLNGGYTQTSGSGAQVEQTIQVLNEYIAQLNTLLENVPPGVSDSPAVNALRLALQEYQEAIDSYLALDGESATEQLQKLVEFFDLTVNLSDGGEIASQLQSTLNDVLAVMPDGNIKNMLELYTQSCLNLGESLQYSVDSRLQENLTAYSQEMLADSSQPTYSPTPAGESLYNIMSENIFGGRSMNELSGQITINENGQFTVTDNIGSVHVLQPNPDNPNEYIAYDIKLNTFQSPDIIITVDPYDPAKISVEAMSSLFGLHYSLDSKNITIDDDLVSSETIMPDVSTPQGVRDVLELLTEDTTKTELVNEVLSEINVYREGNYSEILPNSYNAETICSLVTGSSSSGGNCGITPPPDTDGESDVNNAIK